MVSRIEQRHIYDHHVDTFVFRDDAPLVLDFLVVSSKPVDTLYKKCIPRTKTLDEPLVVRSVKVLAGLLVDEYVCALDTSLRHSDELAVFVLFLRRYAHITIYFVLLFLRFLYCKISDCMALVCPDIVIHNFDVFQSNLKQSRLRCRILPFLVFSLVFSFFLRYKWISKITGIPRPPLSRNKRPHAEKCRHQAHFSVGVSVNYRNKNPSNILKSESQKNHNSGKRGITITAISVHKVSSVYPHRSQYRP